VGVSIPISLHRLAGSWKGTSTLVFPGATPPETTSESLATVAPVARGRFLRIDYTWSYQNESQEGTLLVGREKKSGDVHVVWCDSWHQGETFMISAGRDVAGAIDVLGHYPAATGPDWGWRTTIRPSAQPSDNEGWELVMHNISSDGQEMLAFRNVYMRADDARS
jgi:hypothetical protein